ncbi:MAG: xanthine dehydrogenase family protein subunit M [Deltaproteobacteria bacterium]|nr:xanthine dehydrogenase family protein subunit M [Deltaproteobacteria bacterium]
MQYWSPGSIEEAVGLLSETGATTRALAGGTDLLAQIRIGGQAPERVIDLKRIPELGRIDVDAEGFRIGAAVCGAEIGEHEELRAAWPGVVEAAELIGSTQIQGRASLGGNLCNASPAADSVPALIAAGATCTLAGPDGRREVRVEDVVLGPGQTSLALGEIVVDFRLPRPQYRTGDAYLRLIPRSEMDIAVVGAGVCLSLDRDGHCTACRVALGAVAPRPILVAGAGEALVGHAVEGDALAALSAAASAATDPIDDMRGTRDYRIRVAGVMARRAAVIAAERAASRV